jgi:hypothetical protein
MKKKLEKPPSSPLRAQLRHAPLWPLLLIATAITALLLLFPPLDPPLEEGGTINRGVVFIAQPPPVHAQIDGPQLMAQCLAVWGAAFAVYLIRRK